MYPDARRPVEAHVHPAIAGRREGGPAAPERPDAPGASRSTTGSAPTDAASFERRSPQRGSASRTNLVDVIEPPTYDALEHMIEGIEQAYNANNQGGGATP